MTATPTAAPIASPNPSSTVFSSAPADATLRTSAWPCADAREPTARSQAPIRCTSIMDSQDNARCLTGGCAAWRMAWRARGTDRRGRPQRRTGTDRTDGGNERKGIVSFSALALGALARSAPAQTAPPALVLRGATVIDGVSAAPMAGVTVVVSGGKIERIATGNVPVLAAP